MAFNALGTIAEAADVQQIIDALTGVSGAGQQLSFNQFNSSSLYAVTIRNLDTTNGYALKVTDASDNVLFQAYKNNLQLGASAANDALAINANISGKVYLGDSANASMTVGITINQGANDDEILAFKSSDIAHGITDVAETDTYVSFKKISATAGGVLVNAFSEDNQAFVVTGHITNDMTTHSTAGLGAIVFEGKKKSGTGTAAVGTDGNIVALRNNGSTTHIFDAEGDSFEDGTGWTAYDDHDDLALLDLVNSALVRANDPIKAEFWQWVGENARKLEDLRLITFNEDGHHFINRSKMQELLVGAMRQMGQRLALTENRLAALPGAR